MAVEHSSNKHLFERIALAFAIIRGKPAAMGANQYTRILQRQFVEATWSLKSSLDFEINDLKHQLALEQNKHYPGSSTTHVSPLAPVSRNEDPPCISSSSVVALNLKNVPLVIDAILCLNVCRGGEIYPVDQMTIIRMTNAVRVLAEYIHSILLHFRKPSDEELTLQKLVLDALMKAQPKSWAFIQFSPKIFLEVLVRQFIMDNDNHDSRERCLEILMHFASGQSALRQTLVAVVLDALFTMVTELNLVVAGQGQLNGLWWRNSGQLIVLFRRMKVTTCNLRASPPMIALCKSLLCKCFADLSEQFPLFVDAICRVFPEDYNCYMMDG